MKMFILILIVTTHYTKGMTTAEFDNQKSCESALEIVLESQRHVQGVCVPKNLEDVQ